MTDTPDLPASKARGLPDPGETLPAVAWPTVGLFFGALLLGLGSTIGYLDFGLPAVAAVAMNAVTAFAMFTVLHDASHHALGRSDAVNALFGRLSLPFVTGLGTFSMFSFIHIEHHRNTNEADGSDPDHWCCAGPRWQRPLRWMTLDVFYIVYWLRNLHRRPRREVVEMAVTCLAIAGLLGLAVAGLGLLPVLVLVILPQRIAVFFLAYAFDYLPHHSLPETARSNRYRATRNRIGFEWLLTPALLSQNYHLVHHLHPSIPFYAYGRAWRRNEATYLERDSALNTWWGGPLDSAGYRRRRGMAPSPADRRAFYRLTVARVDRLTPDSVAITFDVPTALRDLFRYSQGQHLTIRHRDPAAGEIRRAYSICAPVSAARLRIAIRHIPGGLFSSHAVERLRAGDTLDVMPPAGQFQTPLVPGRARTYAAIAVGSGITPILSILATTLEVERDSRFTLLFGNRRPDSIMFRDEIAALAARHPDRLRVLHFLSETLGPQAEAGFRPGRIDKAALEALLAADEDLARCDEWFLCGPEAMVATAEGVLGAAGVPPDRLHHEVFLAAPRKAAGPGTGETAQITVRASGRETIFALARQGETLLDAAMRLRDDLPYSCLGGACGTCRARLCLGAVEMDHNLALGPDDLAAGYILTCQSRPTSDLVTVDFDA